MFIAISTLLVAQVAVGDTLPLSLEEAVERARHANPSLQAEWAEARGAAAQSWEGTQAFLPSIRVDLQGIRTTDPVAVFGLKLRQGVFAAPDLQLDALNAPAAHGGFVTSATVELPVLAPEGLFGNAAARRAAEAREAGARRAAGATTFLVTRAYWGAQLAQRRVDALVAALEAARGHERQAIALRDQGMVTGLDARLAALRAAELEVRTVAARAEAANALARLAALLGLPASAVPVLTDSLATPRTEPCRGGACDDTRRADLTALRLGAEAAALDTRRRWAANLPQVALFGAVSRHGRSTPWGEGSGDWTVGVGVRWNLFPALAGIGAARYAAAQRDAAALRYRAARDNARVEISSARRLVEAARRGVDIARRAQEQARVALEQARLRYRTGAAPITELLDVQAAATTATMNLHAARHDLLVAQAALAFANGVYDQ